MNLPVEINFGANNKIVYLYDANGRKLMKQVIHNTQSHHTDYAPQIGRWHGADPVAQYPSPYIGMGNNPVSLIDPDGLAAVWSWEDETTLWYTRVNDDHIYSRRVPMSDNAPDLSLLVRCF